MKVRIPHSWNFIGVKQVSHNDCLPACIATVMKTALSNVLSLKTITESVHMTRRGCHLTEAGIFLQDSLFKTNYELWGWQPAFPQHLVGKTVEETKQFLEEHSSKNGLYKGGKYLQYLDVGGTLILGGSISSLRKNLDENKLAIVMLDDYTLNGMNTKRIAKHAVVLYKPYIEEDSQVLPCYVVYCPTQDYSYNLYDNFQGLERVTKAISNHPRGAVLYIDDYE